MLRWTEGPTGQHIELGICRDEPVPAARPARPGLGPVRPAAAADRHGLRPVRLPRARRVHLRHLLGRAVRRRRHAVGGHARAGGRRAPVARSRRRSGWSCPASRSSSRPTRARSTGCCATRWPGSPAADRGACVPAADHPADRPGAVRGGPGPARRRGAAPAGARRRPTGWSTPSELAATGAPVVHLAASGAVLPEVLAAAAELADEGIAAHVVDVTSLDRLYTAWRGGLRTESAPRRRPRGPAHCARRCSRAARADRDRARRRLARDGVARLRARGRRAYRWAWTRSASPARCRSSTSCTTSRPARSSTPLSRRSPCPAERAAAGDRSGRQQSPGLV